DGTVSTFASGLNYPYGLAFDASGNLLVGKGDNTISRVTPGTPSANAVTIQSSLPNRPMSLGGTNNAVSGINLPDAELARIVTTADGTVTVGDPSQTGDITLTTATLATTVGTTSVVLQSTSGQGKIVLQDGATAALSGNGGSIRLTAGSGGIQAGSAN